MLCWCSQVWQSVNATGGALWRLKRRNDVTAVAAEGGGGDSDEHKIKTQIILDVQAMKTSLKETIPGDGDGGATQVMTDMDAFIEQLNTTAPSASS